MVGQRASRIAVLALLRDDEVLLLQRSSDAKWMPNVWHVPGGRVEEGESVQEAAVREIAEELGVQVSVDDLVFQGVVAYDETDGEDVDTFQFSTRRWTGTPRIMEPHKHQAMQWVSTANLPDNTTPHSKALLKDINRAIYVQVTDGSVDAVIE